MPQIIPQLEGITYTTLTDLQQQANKAKLLKFGIKDLHASQAGQHLSVHKGRGMDFAETRPYQVGDDIRHLDWRVTARTSKPHTKLFSEEREKPVFILLDLRPSMYFGSRQYFKSVLACRIASLLIWRAIEESDRAGGIIIQADGQSLYQPQRDKRQAGGFIRGIAEASSWYGRESIGSNERPIKQAIATLSKIASAGSQLVIISDFRGFTNASVDLLSSLQGKVSLKLVEITDPLESSLAEINNLSVRLTNGIQKLTLTAARQAAYREKLAERKEKLALLEHSYNTQKIVLSTADEENHLMFKLMRGLQ